LVQVVRESIKDAMLSNERKVNLNILNNHINEKSAFREEMKA
jgi:hypothetical protein